MKVLLVGINAKFIHSNLAIRLLKKYAEQEGYAVDIVEYTINQNLDNILSDIAKQQPDIIGFSCYLWNIEYILKICGAFKKIAKESFVFLGGPEVSYDGHQWLLQETAIDAIIYGEGEETFKELLESFQNPSIHLDAIDGLIYRKQQEIFTNRPKTPMQMDDIPFVYEQDMADFKNRIIYYESSRGCPFNCQYCISSIEKGVRFRNSDLVKEELQFFLDHQVMQVKFVDRTFNCNKKHTMAIWQYLHAHDNGVTNFHFEISADLLDKDTLDFLAQVRPGLFQFEIGVQSTYEKTLEAIDRKADFMTLVQNVIALKIAGNIHLHLDLIVGLPYEDYQRFSISFNEVYGLRPEQFQIGFLKVLRGSGMQKDCETFGITYRDYAPYEVLSTKDMTYFEINQLKMLEEMVEIYYNSGHYENTVLYLERFFRTPFHFYSALAGYWESKAYHKISHSKFDIANIIMEFGTSIIGIDLKFLNEVIKFDWCLQEKVKRFPENIVSEEKYKTEINEFYKKEANISKYLPQLEAYASKQISRMAHIEVFAYDMTKYYQSKGGVIDREASVVLFNYFDRDQMRHDPRIYKLDFEHFISKEI